MNDSCVILYIKHLFTKTNFIMEDVRDLSVELLSSNKYFPVYRVQLYQGGQRIIRDQVIGKPSIHVVIYNKTRQKLVLVKQLRVQQLLASIKEDNSDTMVDNMSEICKGKLGT